MAMSYERLRWWENSLNLQQALLNNNYVVGYRLNFSLKSKSSLKSGGGKDCQKQIDIYVAFFKKLFFPGEVLEKTEERLVYGIEYNSTLLECTPRTLQAKVIWFVQRAHETKKEEVTIIKY